MGQTFILHSAPYAGTNNRKRTAGRIASMPKIQSIPIFERDKNGRKVKLIGFKYLKHQPPLKKYEPK